MILGQVFSPKGINTHLESTEKDEVLEEMVEEFITLDLSLNRSTILEAILEREAKLSTGIGHGVAVPHGMTSSFSGVKGVIGISREGIDFDSFDKAPVHLIFMLMSGPQDCEYHVQVIKRLAQVLELPGFMETIASKTTAQDIYDALIQFEETIVVTA